MPKKNGSKSLDLALQGGGSHGAFTWGVLDRLLEEEDIEIKAISGTSAGAMNAAVLVDGYVHGDRAGAKAALEKFWRTVSEKATLFSPSFGANLDQMMPGWGMQQMQHWASMMTQMFSPYELNPLNINPLREVLSEVLDCSRVNSCSTIRLFITATHVASGQARVFTCEDITHDVLLASACIPLLFHAVSIEGEDYWDGGYMGNPSIWPLIYHTDAQDVLLVQINPVLRRETPTNAAEIMSRLNEITFNASLISELRAIQFVKKLIHQGRLRDDEYKNMRMHHLAMPSIEAGLNASSKTRGDYAFFSVLRDLGRGCAEDWIKRHKKDLGVRSTMQVEKFFLTPQPASS